MCFEEKKQVRIVPPHPKLVFALDHRLGDGKHLTDVFLWVRSEQASLTIPK